MITYRLNILNADNDLYIFKNFATLKNELKNGATSSVPTAGFQG